MFQYRYDLNPITVRYHEDRPPIYHFLTTVSTTTTRKKLQQLLSKHLNFFQVCAIVGGTFTVAGIIDSCIFSGRYSSHISITDLFIFQRLKSSRSLSWANLIEKGRKSSAGQFSLFSLASGSSLTLQSNFCPCN